MYVFRDTIKQEKLILLAFLLFSTLFIALVIFIYPGDAAAVEQIAGFEDMGDWEAVYGMKYGSGSEFRFWLAFLVFSYVGILFTAIPALMGTNVFSKENDDNTLDFLMGNPITSRKILLEKVFSVLLMSLGSIIYLFLLIYGCSVIIGQNLDLEILFASCLQLYTLLIFTSLLSIFFAVLFLDSGRARRYIGFIIIGSFIISMVVLFSKELELLKYLQVFYYYDSASTILKPSLSEVIWDKAIYLMAFSIILFGLIFLVNSKRDLVPLFSHKIQNKKHRERSIPFLFFYVRKLQNRYPSFVEEIQSDKLIIYLFALLMTTSGLITPLMYPGDASWLGASKAYGSMDVLMAAMLRDHGVALSFIGYIATEGFGEFFLYAGLVAMILGSKIIVRDQKSNTLDLLFSQSTSMANIFKQRLAGITLEIFTLFLLNYIAYIVGIFIYGQGYEYIIVIGIGIFLTYLIVITMTYLIVLISIFIRNPGRAVAIAGGFYFGLLLLFLIPYTIDQIRFISTLTPFYWIDRIRILYDKTIILEDVIAFVAYITILIATFLISNKKIAQREFIM